MRWFTCTTTDRFGVITSGAGTDGPTARENYTLASSDGRDAPEAVRQES